MEEDEVKEKPPEPENSGVKLEQTVTNLEIDESELSRTTSGGITHYPLTSVVKGITDLGIKGHSAMVLLYANTKRLESDLIESKTENKTNLEMLNAYKQKYFEEKEKNSILDERIKGGVRLSVLQNILLTLGGIMSGAGVQNLTEKVNGVSIIISGLGLALILIGWLWPNNESKEVES